MLLGLKLHKRKGSIGHTMTRSSIGNDIWAEKFEERRYYKICLCQDAHSI